MRPTLGRWRVWIAGLALSLFAAPAPAQEAAKPNTATTPEAGTGGWARLHESFVERARKGPIDLLFIGDSITQGWGSASDVWDKHFAPRNAANFGISGDRTEGVLYRLAHGELEGISPKAVVLMIGTNNIGHGRNNPAETVEGIAAVVRLLREKLPSSQILLLGVFPRGTKVDKAATSAPVDPRIGEINAGIARLDDGKMVHYLDIGPKFLGEDGSIPKALMPDYLHLSHRGYEIWADAIESRVAELTKAAP